MELEGYLKKEGIWHRFIEKPATIHTADAAAKAGLDLSRLTKSLVLLDDNKQPILAVIPGDRRLSFGKLCKAIGSKKVWLVKFEEADKYSGYPPGATPLLHHKEKMKVVISEKLSRFETIYGGGGERTKLLELKLSDVMHLNNAAVADITE